MEITINLVRINSLRIYIFPCKTNQICIMEFTWVTEDNAFSNTIETVVSSIDIIDNYETATSSEENDNSMQEEESNTGITESTISISDEELLMPQQKEHYDETLEGRGRADDGWDEPEYIGVIGYAVISATQAHVIENNENFEDTGIWVVPTYEKDKQFWDEIGFIPHKTEVVVREQILHHDGHGFYSGYLLVETTNDKTKYYINVYNFVTKPYWTYQTDLHEAAMIGDFVAQYKQVSDYYPVDSGGKKLEIPEGTIVLVTGVTSSSRLYNIDETGIEAVVWKEWANGYGGVKCHFNENDLIIVD